MSDYREVKPAAFFVQKCIKLSAKRSVPKIMNRNMYIYIVNLNTGDHMLIIAGIIMGSANACLLVIVIVYLFHRSLWLNSATGCRTCQKT
jgi:hypothetical protein